MMTENYGYYKIIDYEKFEKIVKQRIKLYNKLYLYYKNLSKISSGNEKKQAEEKMKEYFEDIIQGKFLLEEAKITKEEAIFLLDEIGTPVILRVGKTLKKEFEERLKENKKMYI